MAEVRNTNWPTFDAFGVGWDAEDDWDAEAVQVSEKWADMAKKSWGAAKNFFASIGSKGDQDSIKFQLNGEEVVTVKKKTEFGKSPRAQIGHLLETYGTELRRPNNRVPLAIQLGRASRRTFKHAWLNKADSAAWMIIFGSALYMHPLTTINSTVIFTALAASYRIFQIAQAQGEEASARSDEEQVLARLKVLGAQAAEKVYDGSKMMREHSGKNVPALFGLALIMGITAQLRASVPAMQNAALLTAVASATTGFASAHYWAQEF